MQVTSVGHAGLRIGTRAGEPAKLGGKADGPTTHAHGRFAETHSDNVSITLQSEEIQRRCLGHELRCEPV